MWVGLHEISAPRSTSSVRRLGVATAVGDVPLARRDDLERLVALLVEVRHPLGGRRLAFQVAGGAQQAHHRLTGAEGRLAGELGVRRLGPVGAGGDPLRGLAVQPAVAADDGADRQLQLAPPRHVGQVAERAAHRDAGALVGLGGPVGHDGDLDAEDRRGDGGAEQVLVALVVGVGDQRDDGGDQLGARGLDVDLVGARVEGDPVVGAGVLPRLELGLRDGGLEGDVPQRGGLLQVGLAAGEVAQEGALGRRLGRRPDGGVGLLPVDREAERAPQRLEDLLVLDDQLLAELDEVRPADRDLPLRVGLLRRGEVGVVGQRRVAAHAEVVLDAPLGRQAVVVPAHRVEDLLAAHPLEAGDEVGVGVGEDVADVQRARDGRRRGVDRVDALARRRTVEGVGLLVLPGLRPPGLEALQRRLVRYGDAGGGRRRGPGRALGVSHGANPTKPQVVRANPFRSVGRRATRHHRFPAPLVMDSRPPRGAA